MQMLYACPNVQTTTYGAKMNQPPMKAFRAPGFVEGTFGLESLLDELAAKLDLDPLELRRRNYAENDPADDRPYSSKSLLECYRRAEPHWERRHEVRARSTETVKRGVGMASQIWYGGGGPPSYAWMRVGSDGRATVVTAMQDIGTGTKTAMAQIAAEELGIPLDHVTVSLGDSARGPYASISAGSSTTPSMGPAVRAAAADAKRQIVEIAEQRFDRVESELHLEGGKVVSLDGKLSAPLDEVVGLLENAQILGKGARGPNPTGMQVLTFGVQVAEVAVDVETGEVWVERIAAVHDVGRVINPLGASSQIEGGIIQGIGHTLSEERLHDPATGRILTTGLDAYKLPTIADVPEIVSELIDEPDAHLTNLGSKGLGEPPIVPTAAAIANAIRDATGADVRQLPITREEMLRALREADERAAGGEAWSSGRRLASTTWTAARRCRRHRGGAAPARRPPRGGRARRHPQGRPARDRRHADRRGDHARRARGVRRDPGRAARGVPARREPSAPQHGDARRQPAAVDTLLVLAARLAVPPARRRRVLRARRRAPRARDLRERLLRVGAPLRRRGGAARARRDGRTRSARELPSQSCTGCPTEDDRRDDDARAGRADPAPRGARSLMRRRT